MLLCAAGAVALVAAAPQAEPDLAGEAGLFVWEKSDSVVVQWITASAVPGFLRATSDKHAYQVRTDSGVAHRAAFPARDAVFALEYGSVAAGDRHRTVIDRTVHRPRVELPAADSVYVLGDTHGEYDSVVRLLKHAGLVDAELQWTGGHKQLVLLGDVMDRGADVTKLFWLLYRLEREAEQQHGGVQMMLGNHEIMVMLGDLRYVHDKEQQIARLHQVGYARLFDPRASILGRWLTSKPSVIKLDRLLFAHGGISSDYAGFTVKALADSVNANVKRELFYAQADSSARIVVDSVTLARFEDFFFGERSIFWYRGYARSDSLGTELDHVLQRFGADTHLIGHTAQPQIHYKYGGKLIAVHPKQPGTEMLLLAREKKGYRAERITLDGTHQVLSRSDP